MSEIFRPQADFSTLLHDTVRMGWAFEADGLSLDFCSQLLADTNSLQFQRFSKHNESVDVETESHIFCDPFNAMPRAICLLHEKLTQKVRMAKSVRLQHFNQWLPNEVTVQRFTTRQDQISRHQDFGHDRILVVIFTIEGSGPFSLYRTRDDQVPYERCETATGSVALLWAPGLEGECPEDRRPVHSADPAYILPRTTIAFRMTLDKPS